MKILITGGSGQLAKCLENELSKRHIDHYSFSKDKLDITNLNQCKSILNDIQPNIIINTAAYTKVDEAEKDYNLAFLINHKGVENLVKACERNDIKILHISSDYVFDGKKESPYETNDSKNPISIYGKSKLAGEDALMKSNINYIILRTSWVYSQYKENFLKTMLRLSDKNTLKVINDQIGCPTSAIELSKAISQMLSEFYKNKNTSKIYHFSGNTVCTWAQFARHIFQNAEKNGLINSCPQIEDISSNEYFTDADRPNYSVLNCSEFYDDFDVKKTDLDQDLTKVLKAIKKY
jgi:dTDP-4-dehydrorhamnose reductase